MSEGVGSYGWENPADAESTGYLRTPILDLLKGYSAKRVLDIGCGNGSLCGHLKRAGFDVAGVEYDAEGVAIARAQHPTIKFYNFGVGSDPRTLLGSEERFDAAVCTEVVEHLFAPHMLPKYAHAVLKPGGHLIVSTPYHGYLKNIALSVAGKWDFHHTALWHGGHIKFWSRKTLTQLLESNGFEVKSFQGAGRMPYLWKSMILAAVRR